MADRSGSLKVGGGGRGRDLSAGPACRAARVGCCSVRHDGRRFAWFTSGWEGPGRGPMSALPTGTVTFLFTDVEGSSRLWEQYPEAMKAALARHDELLREAVEAHHGWVVKTTGDGVH